MLETRRIQEMMISHNCLPRFVLTCALYQLGIQLTSAMVAACSV